MCWGILRKNLKMEIPNHKREIDCFKEKGVRNDVITVQDCFREKGVRNDVIRVTGKRAGSELNCPLFSLYNSKV
jgi:hypothetical protein